jgi:hypothetical protein
MQDEIGLDAAHILGVNGAGYESGNDVTCQGRDIPWLQDTVAEHMWTQWGITYRDVLILNRANEPVGVYNLTTYDLADPANYATLRDMILAAQAAP